MPIARLQALVDKSSGQRQSPLGQKQTRRNQMVMSALPPKADIRHGGIDVRLGPQADISSPLSGGDERSGQFLRPVHHHLVAAGYADELPVPIILKARAELLER
jgi:hypothetical protein